MRDSSPKDTLKSDTLGLLGAATFGVVMMSPAITLYASFGPAFLSAGRAAPVAFALAFLATLPTALSYALLSREHPESGSAAGWIARLLPARPAATLGWVVFFYYFLNFIIQPVTMGVFLNELFEMLGLPTGFPVFAAGAVLCCAIPAPALYRGISPSSKGALGFLLVETAVVVALCATVAAAIPRQAPLALSLNGLNQTGFFQAAIFGVFSFCGYDVISTLAEETRAPRRLIPLATLLALSLFALLVIAGVWVLSMAADAAKLNTLAEAGGMPIREIARLHWGKGAVLVPITAISAALGLVIATGVGSSRVLYSLGRNGQAPVGLSRIHPRYQVPWTANHLIFGTGLALTLVTGAILGSYRTWVWWGAASTLFAMVTFAAVNLSNFLLFRARAFSSPGSFVLHALVPAAGIALDAGLFYKFVLVTERSILFFDLACVIVGCAFALRGAGRAASAVECA